MAVDDINLVNSESSMMAVKIERPSGMEEKESTIHSGHFMVSRVHDVNNEEDEEAISTSPFSEHSKGFDFMNATMETMNTYNFGNQSIDESLTKLFECMTLAYSGKITSPRWKQFRGLHLSQKQRIRLNNLIWREWHNQYIYTRHPMVCQFATPLSDDIHTKPEAVVLEGKYWKRRLDTVTAEYKNWRRYFKDRLSQRHLLNFEDTKNLGEEELLDRVGQVTTIPFSSDIHMANTDLNLLQAESMDIDFTNELLFSSLNHPFPFPNPRELSQLGYADFIQPGLIQLQPNLDDVMDIDPMQEFLTNRLPPSLFPDASPLTEMPHSFQPHGGSEMTFADFLNNTKWTIDGNGNNFITGNSAASVSASQSQPSTSSPIVFAGNSLISNNSASIHHPHISHAINSSSTITLPLAPQNGNGNNATTAYIFGGGDITTVTASPATMGMLMSQNLNIASPPSTLTFSQQQQQQQHPTANPISSHTIPIISNLAPSSQPKKISTNYNSLLAQAIQQPIRSSSQSHVQMPSSILEQLQKQSPSFPPGSIMLQALGGHSSQQSHQHQQQHQQQQQQQQQQKQQSLFRNNSAQGRRLLKSKNIGKVTPASGEVNASGMITDLAKLAQQSNNKKRDAFFAVPNNVPRKPRMIAPAPALPTSTPQNTSSSPSYQASYLARLLKEGTYPRAFVDVKEETSAQTPSSLANIQSHISALAQQLQAASPVMPPTMMTPIVPVNTYIKTAPPPTTVQMPTVIDISKISSQELNNILSGTQTVSNLGIALSSIVPTEPTIHIDHKPIEIPVSPVNLNNSNILPPSPTVKRSPSPVMDISNPSSPFSLLPSSPPECGDSNESGDSLFSGLNKKAAHLSAEQKRRSNMKTGFDKLQMMVPSLTQNPKVSKATMLQKTAEFCKKLKSERSQMQKEAVILKQEIESLNQAISNVQSQLPETGVPVSRQRKYQMEEMFEEYVRSSTMENWKFWIFSVITNYLYDSYCNSVSTVTMEEMCRTCLTWLDQSCSLVSLRPNVLNALRKLSTQTSILTEPEKMKEQALKAISKPSKISKNIKML